MTLVKFRNQFPSFLDEFFGGDLFEPMRTSNQFGHSTPAVNVKEKENAFTVEVAAPGMKKEDFSIELDHNILAISSENKEENEEQNERYSRREFKYTSFKRSFTLPEGVDTEKISASYLDGILSIEIPKVLEEAKPKSKLIAIN